MKRGAWMWMVLAVFVCGCAPGGVRGASAGDDVVAAFERAARGEPLRYVAIGGSITEASGPGWVGDWLREQFPRSEVTVVNSGMSGTGSSLGIFRIERDVIAHQPDLVAIEYCVNDGALTDEQAIRYVESMVVRLKSLPNPPAIVILEAATRHGVVLERHRKVARHYGLLEVDWQKAIDDHLAPDAAPFAQGADRAGAGNWNGIFNDEVHPNKAGHALYAQAMRAALAPLVERAKAGGASAATAAASENAAALPAPLSGKPLLLDGRMTPLQGWSAPGWKSESTPATWWGRFFQGLLTAAEPGTVLRIPFRGTTAGVFFAMKEDHGSFFANIDGGVPRHVFTNTRGGFGSINIGSDLAAREHVLTVVLPARSAVEPRLNGPVKLGYLLVAGETGASRGASPQGAFTAGGMRDLRFEDIAASAWGWAGPFPGGAGLDARAELFTKFLPEPGDAGFDAGQIEWKPVTGEGATVDMRMLSGSDRHGVAYAKADFDAGEGGEALLSVTVDYYAQLWLNGERILVFDGPHPRPHFMQVRLKAGANEFLIKTASGSAGHNFALRVAKIGAAR